MATYHIDFVNGNDASDGLSWAAAWKTFANGATAARLGATPDTIKVAKSPDPIVVGTSDVTWTSESSATITIPGLDVLVLDNCESGWVSAGPTLTYPTTAFRQGAASTQFVASAQAGQIGYKNFASVVDASTYSRLTMWVNFSTAQDFRTTSNLRIQLCSSTNGNSVTNTLAFPLMYYPANYWVPITIDNGGAMGNALYSILLSTQSSFTGTVRIDNICVTGAESSATSLVLTDVIAKDNSKGEFYPVTSLGGTGVVINPAPANAMTSPTVTSAQYYYSVAGTETIRTLKRWGIDTSLGTTTGVTSTTSIIGVVRDCSPYDGLFHTYVGGWNTSSDVVDGETWFDGRNGYGYGLGWENVGQLTGRVENFGLMRYYIGTAVGKVGGFNSTANLSFVSNDSSSISVIHNGGTWVGTTYYQNPPPLTLDVKWIVQGASANGSPLLALPNGTLLNHYGPVSKMINVTVSNVRAYSLHASHYVCNFNNLGWTTISFTGDVIQSGPSVFGGTLGNYGVLNINNVISLHSSPVVTYIFNGGTYNQVQTDNSTSEINISGKVGRSPSNPVNVRLHIFYNMPGQIIVNGVSSAAEFVINTAITSNTDKHIFATTNTYPGVNFTIKNCVYTNCIPAPYLQTSANGRLIINNYNRVDGDNRVYCIGNVNNIVNYWRQQTTTTYTGTTAWEFLNGTTDPMHHPMYIGDIIVAANSAVTLTVRCRSTGATLYGYLQIVPKNVAGVVSAQAQVSTTNTWELLTLTFTPTENGVVSVWIDAYGIGTGSVYFDDLQVSQA